MACCRFRGHRDKAFNGNGDWNRSDRSSAATDDLADATDQSGVGQALAIKGVDGFDRSTPVDGSIYVDVNEHGRTIRRGAKL